MSKRNLTLLIISLTIILVILFLMAIILQTKKNNQKTSGGNTTVPTPTSVENIFEVPSTSPGLSATEIPATNTGAIDGQFSEAEKNLVTQKQTLRSKLPINNSNFVIVFDYSEDKFIVKLKDPTDTNKTVFENWLKTNYPAIPEDRFVIK